jgi:hypothetical protein
MTFFATLAVLLVAGSTLLVLAGREFLRTHHYPPAPVRSLADLVHLASLGYDALNQASEDAARRRMHRPCG